MSNLAERLKLAFDQSPIKSRAELARRIKMSQQNMNDLFTGVTRTSSRLIDIAWELSVDPRWLATGEGLMFGSINSSGMPAGLAEDDVMPFVYKPEAHATRSAILDILAPGRENTDIWVVRTRALEDEGYKPGDRVIVDLDATPQIGCIVCAQIYDWDKGDAKTLLRLYEHPYLVAATSDPRFRKPELIDDKYIIIKGVVVASFRIFEDL